MGSTSEGLPPDSYALDDALGVEYGGDVYVWPASSQSISRSDSPSEGLNFFNDHYSVNDTCELYLMYCPPGGIWVTLQRLDWSWNGYASLIGGTWNLQDNGYWRNTGGTWTKIAGSYSPAGAVGGVEDHTLPEWTDSWRRMDTFDDVYLP
jgi:hypothetical protein